MLSFALRRPEFLYSAALFVLAGVAMRLAVEHSAPITLLEHPGAAVFFLLYGLLTITTGYHHPRVGHVSFDRVSQVASILVLGPVDAAIVNGLASFLYPWHRLWRGYDLQRVITASLNNSGLMTLMTLGGGLLYQGLGGQVPLVGLDWSAALLLPLLLLSMQAVNELGMGIHLLLRDGQWARYLNRFVLMLESSAGMAAVVVAIVFNRMELPVLVLLLALITTVMIVVTQFAGEDFVPVVVSRPDARAPAADGGRRGFLHLSLPGARDESRRRDVAWRHAFHVRGESARRSR